MLLSNLNLLASAPGGVARLRELILTLAEQSDIVARVQELRRLCADLRQPDRAGPSGRGAGGVGGRIAR